MIILFNKPFNVVCQFSPHDPKNGKLGHATLKDFISVPNVYPAGRLDADSEGLLILTDDGNLQYRLSHPKHKEIKTYWVQVEGTPSIKTLRPLTEGINLGDFIAQPAQVNIIDEPPYLWRRQPPIRVRKTIPTTWLEVKITEGKNRQVRRMTAKVGFPTLRLIRYAIGKYSIDRLSSGDYQILEAGGVAR